MKLQKRFLIFKIKQNKYVLPSSQVKFVFKNEKVTSLPLANGPFLSLTVIRGEIFSCAFLNQKKYANNYSIILQSNKGKIALVAEDIIGLEDNFPKNAYLISAPDLIKDDFNLSLTPKDKWFHFINGDVAKNILELKFRLSEATERVYTYHSNHKKNDFKNWLDKVFGLKELAEKIKNVKDKKEFISLI
jgi:hypothetical protein